MTLAKFQIIYWQKEGEIVGFGSIMWTGCWIACILIARQKGRSIPLAVVVGFFLGIFALVYYLVVPAIGFPPKRPWIDELTGKKDTTERLEELKKLHEQGMLSDEEYKKAKEKVIDQM